MPPRSRADHSLVTRQSLVDHAQELFGTRGFAETPLADIVAEAGLTKGALYHHFESKRELFAAVFHQVVDQSTARITEAVTAIGGEDDPDPRAAAGLRMFLTICREETYRRVIVEDGPSVLGPEIHLTERRSAFGTVVMLVREMLEPDWAVEDDMVRTLGRVLYAAMTSVGAAIAVSDDPDAETVRSEQAILLLLQGMRHTVATHPDLESALASRSGG